MPQVIETTVYNFNELNDKAKDKARSWYREGAFDYEWYDFVKTDFESFLEAVGFKNVSSQFSGFWSQGDGASFDFKCVDFTKLLTPPEIDQVEYGAILNDWLTENGGLIRKARRIAGSIHAESCKNGYGSHYCHSKTRYVSMELDAGGVRDFLNLQAVVTKLENQFTLLCRFLADKYYSNLSDEWDYLNSDDAVGESIEANEYTFTAAGKRF